MESYIGQICLFGFNFAPNGWAHCNGQLMSIAQNSALFSLLGTTYGGDGVNTFALPNLQGRVPIHQDNNHEIGERGGIEEVTLNISQMPTHTHVGRINATEEEASSQIASSRMLSQVQIYASGGADETLSPAALSILPAGDSLPHTNMQPYLTVNYCICLNGIYPSRS